MPIKWHCFSVAEGLVPIAWLVRLPNGSEVVIEMFDK